MFEPFSMTAFAIYGLTAAAVGTGVSVKASYDQSQAARKSSRIAKRQAAIQQARDRASVIRQMQVEQARQAVAAGYSGMGFGSSSFAGAQAGAQSTTAASLSNINQARTFANQNANVAQQMANAQTLGSIGTGLTNLGGSIMGAADPLSRVGTYFTSQNKPALGTERF